MAFELMKLPYAMDALAPHISAETIEYHYGKHHQGYVNKLNEMIKGTKFESMPLEDIIKNSEGTMFNQVGQISNHNVYWNCMSPKGGGAPKGPIADLVNKSFGSFDRLKDDFAKVAGGQFGSGWGWLAQDSSGNLKVLATPNAHTPITEGYNCLLACDVWEHAYYIDYRNARAKYIEGFWNLVNWDYVNQKLK